MNKIVEKVLDLAVRALVKVVDHVDRRREQRQRPDLDPRLDTLSVEEAANAAEKARRAKYNAH